MNIYIWDQESRMSVYNDTSIPLRPRLVTFYGDTLIMHLIEAISSHKWIAMYN